MKACIKLSIAAVVIFMLLGFFFAAAARVRDAANLATCQNNLKQISLATIKTADDYNGRFPMATMPHPTEPPYRRLSWMLWIYRNMQCGPIYSGFDTQQPWDSERNLPHSQQMIRTYICPGNGTASAALACGGSSHIPRFSAEHLTHYVGISGVGQNAAFLPLDDSRCGAFGHERRAFYPKGFTDGVAQTILIMETAARNGPWAAGDVPTLRYIDPDVNPQIGPGAPFGRSHGPLSVIAQVGLADGSVRALSPSIDTRVLAAAATIAGDDILDNDW